MNFIKTIRIVFIVVIWASLVWSCQNEEQVLPLTVTSVTPANDATGIKVDAPIVITFSRPVTKTPINLTGIVLTKSTGEVVTNSKTFNENGTVVTITPNGTLANNTVYKLAVKDVQADDGAIVTSFNSSFTTVSPLKVLSIVPAEGSQDLNNLKQVVFTLDKKVTNTKSNIDCIRFGEFGSDGVLVVRPYPLLVKSISDDGLSVIISFPEYMLSVGVKYAAALDKLVAEDGSMLSYAATTFTMKDAPLAIANITPANGAINVALDSKVVVIFNKQMKASMVPGFTVSPKNGESWTMDFDGMKTVTFTCKTALKSETKYDFIKFGDITSYFGEKMDKLPDFSFTTGK